MSSSFPLSLKPTTPMKLSFSPSSKVFAALLACCALSAPTAFAITLGPSIDTRIETDDSPTNTGGLATANYVNDGSLSIIDTAGGPQYRSIPLLKFNLAGQPSSASVGHLTLSLTGTLGGGFSPNPGTLFTGDLVLVKYSDQNLDLSTVTYAGAKSGLGGTDPLTNVKAQSTVSTFGYSFTAAGGGAITGGSYTVDFAIPQADLNTMIGTSPLFAIYRTPTAGDSNFYFSSAEGATSPSLSFTAVPEPSSYAAMFGAGLMGFGMWRRRQQSRVA